MNSHLKHWQRAYETSPPVLAAGANTLDISSPTAERFGYEGQVGLPSPPDSHSSFAEEGSIVSCSDGKPRRYSLADAPSLGSKIHVKFDGKEKVGTLRYVGWLAGKDGLWAGVELDMPDGKNDGTVNGRRYFSCNRDHGLFCRLKSLQPVQAAYSSFQQTPASQVGHSLTSIVQTPLSDSGKWLATQETISKLAAQVGTSGVEAGEASVHVSVLRGELDESRRYAKLEEFHTETARQEAVQLRLQLKTLREEIVDDTLAFKEDLERSRAENIKLSSQCGVFENELNNFQTSFYNDQLARQCEDMLFSERNLQQKHAQNEHEHLVTRELQAARCREEELLSQVISQGEHLQRLRHEQEMSSTNSRLKWEGEIARLQNELQGQMHDAALRQQRSDSEIAAARALREGESEQLQLSSLTNERTSSALRAQSQELRDAQQQWASARDASHQWRQEEQQLAARLVEKDKTIMELRRAKSRLSLEELQESEAQRSLTENVCINLRKGEQQLQQQLLARLAEQDIASTKTRQKLEGEIARLRDELRTHLDEATLRQQRSDFEIAAAMALREGETEKLQLSNLTNERTSSALRAQSQELRDAQQQWALSRDASHQWQQEEQQLAARLIEKDKTIMELRRAKSRLSLEELQESEAQQSLTENVCKKLRKGEQQLQQQFVARLAEKDAVIDALSRSRQVHVEESAQEIRGLEAVVRNLTDLLDEKVQDTDARASVITGGRRGNFGAQLVALDGDSLETRPSKGHEGSNRISKAETDTVMLELRHHEQEARTRWHEINKLQTSNPSEMLVPMMEPEKHAQFLANLCVPLKTQLLYHEQQVKAREQEISKIQKSHECEMHSFLKGTMFGRPPSNDVIELLKQELASRSREITDVHNQEERYAEQEQAIIKSQSERQTEIQLSVTTLSENFAAQLAARDRDICSLRNQVQQLAACEQAPDKMRADRQVPMPLQSEHHVSTKAREQEGGASEPSGAQSLHDVPAAPPLLPRWLRDDHSVNRGPPAKEVASTSKDPQPKQQQTRDSLIEELQRQTEHTLQVARSQENEWEQQKCDLLTKMNALESEGAKASKAYEEEEQEIGIHILAHRAAVEELKHAVGAAQEENGVLEAAGFQHRQEIVMQERRLEQQAERLAQRSDALHQGQREELLLSKHVATQASLIDELQEKLQTSRNELRAEQACYKRCHLEHLAGAQQLEQEVGKVEHEQMEAHFMGRQIAEHRREVQELVAAASAANERSDMMRQGSSMLTSKLEKLERLRNVMGTAQSDVFQQDMINNALRSIFGAWAQWCRAERHQGLNAELTDLRAGITALGQEKARWRLAEEEQQQTRNERESQEITRVLRTSESRMKDMSEHVVNLATELRLENNAREVDAEEIRELEEFEETLVEVVSRQEQDIDRLCTLQQSERETAARLITEQGLELDELRQQHQQNNKLRMQVLQWEERARKASAQEMREAEIFQKMEKENKNEKHFQIKELEELAVRHTQEIDDLECLVTSRGVKAESDMVAAKALWKREEHEQIAELQQLVKARKAGLESEALRWKREEQEAALRAQTQDEFIDYLEAQLEAKRSQPNSMQSQRRRLPTEQKVDALEQRPHPSDFDTAMMSPSPLLTLSPSPQPPQEVASPPLFPALNAIADMQESRQPERGIAKSPEGIYAGEQVAESLSNWRQRIEIRDASIEDLRICMQTALDIRDAVELRALHHQERDLASEVLHQKREISTFEKGLRDAFETNADMMVTSPGFGGSAHLADVQELHIRLSQQLKSLEALRRGEPEGPSRQAEEEAKEVAQEASLPGRDRGGSPIGFGRGLLSPTRIEMPPSETGASPAGVEYSHDAWTPSNLQQSPLSETQASPKGRREASFADTLKQASITPEVLVAVMPEEVRQCAGNYILVRDQQANGHPLWKQQHGEHFFFSGVGGRWFVGDEEEEEQNFHCNAGIVVSQELHKGVMPDCMGELGGWQRFDGASWIDDDGIIIKRKMPILDSFSSPTGQRPLSPEQNSPCKDGNSPGYAWGVSNSSVADVGANKRPQPTLLERTSSVPDKLEIVATAMPMCMGRYTIVPGRSVNGFPLWKQQDGHHFIFSGVGGRWFVGDDEEEEQGFACNAGVIVSRDLHKGIMPNKLGFGKWQRFDSTAWLDDPSINMCSPASMESKYHADEGGTGWKEERQALGLHQDSSSVGRLHERDSNAFDSMLSHTNRDKVAPGNGIGVTKTAMVQPSETSGEEALNYVDMRKALESVKSAPAPTRRNSTGQSNSADRSKSPSSRLPLPRSSQGGARWKS